jgi:hypothetical protein
VDGAEIFDGRRTYWYRRGFTRTARDVVLEGTGETAQAIVYQHPWQIV